MTPNTGSDTRDVYDALWIGALIPEAQRGSYSTYLTSENRPYAHEMPAPRRSQPTAS